MATIRRLDDTQAEFAEGTLTGVQATATPSLTLAYRPVLSFDGVDDQALLPNLGFSGNTTITFEILVNIHSIKRNTFLGFGLLSKSQTFAFRTGNASESFDYLLYFYANDLRVNSQYVDYASKNFIHLAAIYDANANKRYIYEDGVLLGSDTPSETPNFQDTNYKISGFNNEYVDGDVAYVRIWNTARTQQQIQDNMYRELTGTEPGLVAYYKMNEGNGTTIIDSAGTNNGTIYGATWVNNTNYKFFGYRVTPPLDCTDLTSISSSSVSWTETLNSGTIIIETRVSTDNGNTWTAWTQVTNGGSIPNIAPGCLVECRQNLSTTDISKTPELTSLDIEINRVTTTLMFACNF